MKLMRLSDLLFLILAYLMLWVVLLGFDAVRRNRDSQRRIALEGSIVRAYGLTDLCLATEARYTRHLSQADIHAAFQDHPMALDRFPSGSLLQPPLHLTRRNLP